MILQCEHNIIPCIFNMINETNTSETSFIFESLNSFEVVAYTDIFY